ncbi:MAG TPA: hypothetical protein DCY79_17965 [Planctomycetaceae bacterium]|nr:hypothetical protein [Blastopirellula sp.]HAY81693.1 hypothetical protein [Planctomycetaceae bacterium]
MSICRSRLGCAVCLAVRWAVVLVFGWACLWVFSETAGAAEQFPHIRLIMTDDKCDARPC